MTMVLLFKASLANAEQVGFQQLHLDPGSFRPLKAAVWYPTEQDSSVEMIADNAAFKGTPVVRNAALDTTQRPLVILSHGYGGNWRNLNWLANRLVKTGYVVATVNHPGTTSRNRSPLQAAKWWKRVDDLRRLLDHLYQSKLWSPILQSDNVTAIGHSLGGWTVAQLIGAEFDRQALDKQCERFPNPRVCGLRRELGLDHAAGDEPHRHNFRDQRVQRAIILDLGLARSFSIKSLNHIDKPVLILGAGVDIGDLPQSLESGFLAEHIPLLKRRYNVYEQAMHFSFMPLCKPGAIQLLESESPGDGIVCRDGIGTSRSQLHEKIFRDILMFMNQ